MKMLAVITLASLGLTGCTTFGGGTSQPRGPIIITPDMLPGGTGIPKHPPVIKPKE